jgi:hypothetical protein
VLWRTDDEHRPSFILGLSTKFISLKDKVKEDESISKSTWRVHFKDCFLLAIYLWMTVQRCCHILKTIRKEVHISKHDPLISLDRPIGYLTQISQDIALRFKDEARIQRMFSFTIHSWKESLSRVSQPESLIMHSQSGETHLSQIFQCICLNKLFH